MLTVAGGSGTLCVTSYDVTNNQLIIYIILLSWVSHYWTWSVVHKGQLASLSCESKAVLEASQSIYFRTGMFKKLKCHD